MPLVLILSLRHRCLFFEAMSAVDDGCVTPKFAMIFLSAVMVKLRPFLTARVPPHASNSSPASPALAT
jgi:hypothetical protein